MRAFENVKLVSTIEEAPNVDYSTVNKIWKQSDISDDRLDYAKKCFSELAMHACPLHLALRYKRELAQSSSADGLRKVVNKLIEEIIK